MITKQEVLTALDSVKDPEIPSVSIVDLGMVTSVDIDSNNYVRINLTPTFTGCPAIKMIEDSVREKVNDLKVNGVEVKTNYDVQWNSDMISDNGRELLKKHGLAPPLRHNGRLTIEDIVKAECPYCGSSETAIKSLFGSTLCRSIRYCNNCLQSFEQFKPVV